MTSQLSKTLEDALEHNKLTTTSSQRKTLERFLNLLLQWNSVFNLTRITEPKEMVYGHILDSLTCLPYLEGTRCLDVGSGAGLPGIPLAIMEPERHWTLLDKNSKKVRFLTQAVAELALTNVQVVHSRCQDFHPTACFDSILSRAFAELGIFLSWTEHLICPQGVFIAMKGQAPMQELSEPLVGFEEVRSERVHIQGWPVQRHILCFRKKREPRGKDNRNC